MITTPGTHPREARFGGRTVTFRSLRTEDKELFKTFIRSLPSKDNYYLMVDVYDDQAINRWVIRNRLGARAAKALGAHGQRSIGGSKAFLKPGISHPGDSHRLRPERERRDREPGDHGP
jgi:hypothetical protein